MTIQEIITELNELESLKEWNQNQLDRVNQLENLFVDHPDADKAGINWNSDLKFYLKSA